MTVLLREAIGDRLRHARTNKDRTLREISRAARVSLGYLSEVERGRKEASSELLAAICEALDLPLAELLTNVATDVSALSNVDSALPERETRGSGRSGDGPAPAASEHDSGDVPAPAEASAAGSAAMSNAVLTAPVSNAHGLAAGMNLAAGLPWDSEALSAALLGQELAGLRLSPDTLPSLGGTLGGPRGTVIVAA
ncbi:MAG: helix-turn-helix domain-containing protein [Pseudonocardiaceae bacterium]|nr:helix-turn-helix domain-containing protein [Pseudonocardiaceae bacterium]